MFSSLIGFCIFCSQVFQKLLKGMGDTHDFTDLIRIKIKILHSTTHTLSVERTVRLFFMVKNCVFPCVLLYSIMVSWLIISCDNQWHHICSAIDLFLYGLQIPVRDLKQDICYYCGVSPERQPRLLFRGRVLKNDQRLSDYRILPLFFSSHLIILGFIFRMNLSLNGLNLRC